MTRVRKIEQALADWFQREGFNVVEGVATRWVPDDSDPSPFNGQNVEVDIARLAQELDGEFDKINEAGK